MRHVSWFLVISFLGMGQQPLLSQAGKHALMADILGINVPTAAFLGAGVSYHYQLNSRWELGTGLAVRRIERGPYIVNSLPVFVGFHGHTSRHRPIAEFGIIWQQYMGGEKFTVTRPGNGHPFFSVGYGFEGENLLVRFPIRFVYLNYFKLLPWPGFSLGYRFPSNAAGGP